mgnify:CR=1 FL=1
MEKQIKWFDLSRFSAALKVVANSPLRPGTGCPSISRAVLT